MKNLTEIFDNVQVWLDSKNSKIHPNLITYGGYLHPDERPGYYHPGQKDLPGQYIPYPIQQIKQEIMDFVDAVLKNGKFGNALEVGIGQFGGTHMIWREIFNNVVSIDIDTNVINKFLTNDIHDGRSYIVHANSNDKSISQKLPINNYDVLFIDGHHSLYSAYNDYINLKSLVNKGGMIGFHDACTSIHPNAMEVPIFLDKLSKGEIDGIQHKVHYTKHSMEVGIGWIYV